MTDDVDRLTAELEVAKCGEVLEKARDKVHEKATPANIAAFKEASQAMADARQEFRAQFEAVISEGDAAPKPDTVKVKGKVERR